MILSKWNWFGICPVSRVSGMGARSGIHSMEGAVPIVVQPLPGLGLQIPVGALESELLYSKTAVHLEPHEALNLDRISLTDSGPLSF